MARTFWCCSGSPPVPSRTRRCFASAYPASKPRRPWPHHGCSNRPRRGEPFRSRTFRRRAEVAVGTLTSPVVEPVGSYLNVDDGLARTVAPLADFLNTETGQGTIPRGASISL